MNINSETTRSERGRMGRREGGREGERKGKRKKERDDRERRTDRRRQRGGETFTIVRSSILTRHR